MAARVCVTNLGCRVNRVELDLVAAELEAAGALLVGEDEADAVVVNTCAVTGEAEAKSRRAVRHALALPRHPRVYATGCSAALFAEELRALGERVVVERDKTRVAALVLGDAGGAPDDGAAVRPACGVTPTGRARPGIKVQDGCDLRCSYCIVWKARGRSRSVAPGEVVRQVRAAVGRGAKEVVLTGINLGRYESEGLGLTGLLGRVLDECDVGRVRLSSIEPQDVTRELARLMAGSDGRVAPFLHMCLQSGSNGVLARMGRVYTAEEYLRRADVVRSEVPGCALAADVIAGFPGETDAEFAETLALCEKVGFSKLHVFRYSRRPGTPAAVMAGQVDPRVASERAARLRELSARMRREQAEALVGSVQRVVALEPGRGVSGGLFDVALPEGSGADGIWDVRITGVTDGDTLLAE